MQAVSVVMPTRDRPLLLRMALDCYRHQTYRNRELIVVDDGEHFPADAEAVSAVGGRLIRVPPGTPLGTKLNVGVSEARGPLCQKMDDDDFYAPNFLKIMVSAWEASRTVVCTPTVAFLAPFLFFDVARWEVRRSIDKNMPGATLFFTREDWQERPFRAVREDEDVWFRRDHAATGRLRPVRALESYLAVRHNGASHDRGHTWTRQLHGEIMESYLQRRALHEKQPDDLLPAWALPFYRRLRDEILNAGSQ